MNKRNLSRRDFLRVFATAAAGVTVAACAPKVVEKVVKETIEVEKGVKETVVVEKAPKELPVVRLATDWGTGARGDVSKQAGDLWKAKYEQDIAKVFFEFTPEVDQRVFVEMASGDAPDVMLLGLSEMIKLAKLGLVLCLEPFFENDPTINYDPTAKKFEDLVGTATHAGEEGKVYVIPFQVRIMFGWWWNETLFDEYGVLHPDEYPDNPGGVWQWGDWLETCKVLTKDTDGDGTPDIWGGLFGHGWYNLSGCLNLAWGNGGDWLDLENRDPGFDWPETMEAQNFLFDLVNVHKVSPNLALGSELSEALGMNLFSAGKVGTTHSYSLSSLKRDVVEPGRFKAHFGPIPRSPHKPNEPGHAILSEQPHSIWSGSHYPDEAYQLASYMGGKEVQMFTLKSGQTPCRRSLCELPEYIDWDPETKKWWLELEKHAFDMRIFECWREYRDMTAAPCGKVLLGEISNEEFAVQATEAGQRVLDECEW